VIRIVRALVLLLPATALLLLPGTGLADNATINVADNEFQPPDVTVEEGDTVTWRWVGENPHAVVSPDGGFASHPDCGPPPAYQECGTKDDMFAFTFSTAGTFNFFCQVHGFLMSGTVTVAPAPSPSPSPSPTPKPKPKPTPKPTTPEPSPEPTPEPTATETSQPPLVGPPPPRETDPLPVIEGEVETPDRTPSEPPDIEFEPFVPVPDLPTTTGLDVVVDDDGPSTAARVLATGLAAVLLVGWTVGFGREVLFGEPWDVGWQGQPTD
jgi:plastocyanin